MTGEELLQEAAHLNSLVDVAGYAACMAEAGR